MSFTAADGLRPTGDRMRETLFNWLQWDIRSSRCLDLFAGSGALGFEAASRGAANVVMVDVNPATASQLRQNCEQLQAAHIDVVSNSAEQYLATQPLGFDIVFIDPPFALEQVPTICLLLEKQAVLNPDAQIYVETPLKQRNQMPENWSIRKSTHAGNVEAVLYQRKEINKR